MSTRAAKTEDLSGELRRLFAQAKMPTNPAVASEILRLVRDPSSSGTDFGKVIRTDPALATRLLKTVNSAHFAQRTPVTTIERAVAILGLSQLKTAALGFQLVSHLDRLGGAPFDMKMFWQHALLRACMAHGIAQQIVRKRTDEAFLIGLLQNAGIPLLVQIEGTAYATLYRSDLSPMAFYAVERESFRYTHVDVISALAKEWNLPPMIETPLAKHHQTTRLSPESLETDQLCAIAYLVGGLSFAAGSAASAEDATLQEFRSKVLGLDDAAWTLAQKRAEEEYKKVVTLFGQFVPDGEIDIGDLLGEANRHLSTAASDSEQRMVDIETKRAALQSDQLRLQSALKEYRERAALDPLTNVLNRGALGEATRTAIARHMDKGGSIGVLFLDLDNFKHLNDTYGHAVGDRVLKVFAKLLEAETEQHGTVGRYGGEEFVVLICDLSADAVRETAERIVQKVRALRPEALGFSGTVTCSLGAAWSDNLPVRSAEELFAAADQLMYRAKRTGKDRCCFEVLANSATADSQPSGGQDSGGHASAPAHEESPESLLAEMLTLAEQLNANEVDSFDGIRKQTRKQIVAPCALHYFTNPGPTLREAPAVARNLSSGGVALLVKRPMVRGEPVEVALNKGSGKLFLAGLVAYCKHIDGPIHEVGVQFVSHSVTPIISDNVSTALRHDWVSQALNAKGEGTLEAQLS